LLVYLFALANNKIVLVWFFEWAGIFFLKTTAAGCLKNGRLLNNFSFRYNFRFYGAMENEGYLSVTRIKA
jgi:hypothetical protein